MDIITNYITTHTLEVAGTMLGLLYLWLELKASIWLWIVGILMPAIYIIVYYQAGLYADFGINIYYLLAAFYGLAVWTTGGKKHGGGAKSMPIRQTPHKYYLPLLTVSTILWAAIYTALTQLTDSNVPLYDSFTTALSVTGLWMLARKYTEQWLAWIAVDAVSTGLYIYKELYSTSILYGIYTIIALYGYKKWMKQCRQTTKQ